MADDAEAVAEARARLVDAADKCADRALEAARDQDVVGAQAYASTAQTLVNAAAALNQLG